MVNISEELESKLDTIFVLSIAFFIVLFWFLIIPTG
jgi:hypothetical protein